MAYRRLIDAYKKLPKYCEDLKKSNRFTTAIVDATSDGRFRRMFLSFGASAQGFHFCRPMLGLDGTHLKSKYQGILLSATAVDALGSLFPVAHAVVVAEDDDNWLWFLKHLHQIIQDQAKEFLEPNNLTILSDRQKGLIEGLFPSTYILD
jgi:MULE transposase domain.